MRHLAIVPRLYRRDGRRAFRRRGSPSRMRVGCACERGVRSVDGRAGAGQSMAALAESVMTPLAWKAGRVPGADARPRGLQAGVGTCQTNDGAVGGQPLYRLVGRRYEGLEGGGRRPGRPRNPNDGAEVLHAAARRRPRRSKRREVGAERRGWTVRERCEGAKPMCRGRKRSNCRAFASGIRSARAAAPLAGQCVAIAERPRLIGVATASLQ